MRILVLGGAGAMARGTIRDLLRSPLPDLQELLIADAAVDRAHDLARSLGDPRVRACGVDVSNRRALREVLEQADFCINAVPTFAGQQMAIFDACLEARKTYVDYGGMGVYTARQKACEAAWRQAGATAIIGLGADPGMSNVLCRAVADRLDRIDRINLYWAAEQVGPENPILVPPYSVATVLGEYANNSLQFLDGELREVPPQTGHEVLLLPEPWGRTEFIYSQHSEPVTVPFAESIRKKGIRQFTWKLHLPRREHEAWVGLVKAGFGDFDTPVRVGGVDVTPSAFLETLIQRNIQRNGHRIPAQEVFEVHLATAEGEIDGHAASVNCAVMISPHPSYAGFDDAGTSMGLSIGVQLMLRRPYRPGVWAPEEYFDPVEFLEEAQKRHFRVVDDLPIRRESAPGASL